MKCWCSEQTGRCAFTLMNFGPDWGQWRHRPWRGPPLLPLRSPCAGGGAGGIARRSPPCRQPMLPSRGCGVMKSELVSHHASDANAPRDAVAQRVEARGTFLLPMARAPVRTRTQGQHTCVTVHRLEKKVSMWLVAGCGGARSEIPKWQGAVARVRRQTRLQLWACVAKLAW